MPRNLIAAITFALLLLVGGVLVWILVSRERDDVSSANARDTDQQQHSDVPDPKKSPKAKSDSSKQGKAEEEKDRENNTSDTVGKGNEKADGKTSEQQSEPKPDTKVTVNITNIAEGKGNLRVAIYSDAKGWAKDMKSHRCENEFQLKVIEAKEGSVECVFEQLPPGTYGVSLFHDVDESGKMNMVKKLFSEMPNEPFGFSKDFNPFRKLRAPQLKDCAFEVKEGSPIDIQVTLQ